MSYAFLDKLMRVTDNTDYFADGLSRQTANQFLKFVCEELRSFTSLPGKLRKAAPDAFRRKNGYGPYGYGRPKDSKEETVTTAKDSTYLCT